MTLHLTASLSVQYGAAAGGGGAVSCVSTVRPHLPNIGHIYASVKVFR